MNHILGYFPNSYDMLTSAILANIRALTLNVDIILESIAVKCDYKGV